MLPQDVDIDNVIGIKLRPDILKVKGLPAGAIKIPYSRDKRATYEIQIIEVTVRYCADKG